MLPANKPFNQDESFREACAKTQHNWVMDNSHKIDLDAYSGYRDNPQQVHVGAKCLTCGYCACKHCEFFNVVNECEGVKNDS